jgi:plasmid maintenance system antidote protein VapI
MTGDYLSIYRVEDAENDSYLLFIRGHVSAAEEVKIHHLLHELEIERLIADQDITADEAENIADNSVGLTLESVVSLDTYFTTAEKTILDLQEELAKKATQLRLSR